MNMQLYKRFCQEEFNEHGTLTRFSIHHPDNFNFANDVMDVLAAEEPDERGPGLVQRGRGRAPASPTGSWES